MGRLRLLSLVVILALLLACLGISIIPLSHSSAAAPPSGVTFTNLENFNDYGQFGINDTLAVGSNSNLSAPVSSVSFGFPAAYNGHLVSESASLNNGPALSSSSLSSTVANNTL